MFIVTGANGFIGSVLIWELNQAGYTDIVGVDRIHSKDRTEPLRDLKYSQLINHDQWLNQLPHIQKPKAIFHIGACSSTTETRWDYLKKNNLEYSQKLFSYCAEKNIPFIYASSAAVYGNGKLGFDDKVPHTQFTPLNLYGKSKLDFDVWATKQTKVPHRWYGLRFFNVYGPNESHKGEQASVVFKAFQQISRDKKIRLFKSHDPNYKDGYQKRDFVYVKDITRWILELYKNSHCESGIYNMGSGQARPWLDLARSIFQNMNLELHIDWTDTPESIRRHYQYFTQANMTKWRQQRLSSSRWSLEEGINDYIKNYLQTDSPNLRS